MHPARSGDRNVVGGDRHLPDRGLGFLRRGDRYTTDRWNVSGGVVTPPPVSLNDGDPVSTWPDSSGNGHDATQTGTARPIFKTNIVNGKPVVRFNSAAFQLMNLASTISGNWPFTIFAVMKDTGGGYIMPIAGNSPTGRPLFFVAAGGVLIDRNTIWTNPNPAAGVFHVLYAAAPSSGAGEIGFDGAVPGSSNAGPDVNIGDFAYIGGDIGNPHYSDGDLAELIVYNTVLSSTDRANIEKYLGTKYGITVTSGGTAVQPDTVAGLKGWWKADSLVAVVIPPLGLNDGDPVSLWKDSSTGGHDATQTGTARPTFKTNVIGGKPAVLFNSANTQFMSIAPISGSAAWSVFTVIKPLTSPSTMTALGNSTLGQGPYLGVNFGLIVAATPAFGNASFNSPTAIWGGAFHVLDLLSDGSFYGDGGSLVQNSGAGIAINNFTQIGANGTSWSDGYVAEIIIYNNALALGRKLVVLLTALITTGELPPPAELDAMAGHRDKIKKYLHDHGAHPSNAQLDDVVTPMAVGDRANIEKYLSTKYGIPVTSGGTAVDPSTVAGLMGWWKADSLAAATGPPPFDPTTIAGCKGWWKADAGTSLLRDIVGEIATPVSTDGDPIALWSDQSGNGNNFIQSSSVNRPIYRATGGPSGMPTIEFDGVAQAMNTNAGLGLVQPSTYFVVFDNRGRPITSASPNPQQIFCVPDITMFAGGAYPAQTLATPVVGAWSVLSAIFNGAVSLLYRNGIAAAGNPGNLSTNGQDQIILNGDAGGLYAGKISEILIYNSALSTTDRQNVEAYLGQKYGISFAPPPFDPTTIAGLKLWLKADAITIPGLIKPGPKAGQQPTIEDEINPLAINDGNSVNVWPDSSGLGNDFTNINIAPIYKTGIINSKPVVRFNGTTNGMTASGKSLIPTNSSRYTLFFVLSQASLSAGGHVLFATGIVGAYSVSIQRYIDGLYHTHFDAGNVQASESPIPAAQFDVISADWDGSNIHLWRNGILKATTATASMGNAGTTNSIGYDQPDSSSGWWDGDMAEILVYNSALSTTDRQNVENYLKAKYGL